MILQYNAVGIIYQPACLQAKPNGGIYEERNHSAGAVVFYYNRLYRVIQFDQESL